MPRRIRPSIIPDHKTGFARWRALVFVIAATLMFILTTLSLTAYLGFAHRTWVDTEDVTVLAAERFGRFTLPAGASGFRAQARGSPLAGELMVCFTMPRSSLDAFLAGSEFEVGLRADRRIEQRLAMTTDRRWWWKPYRSEGDRRTFVAGESSDVGLQKLLLIDTTRPDELVVFLYATNR